jgi:hypothetical protein
MPRAPYFVLLSDRKHALIHVEWRTQKRTNMRTTRIELEAANGKATILA